MALRRGELLGLLALMALSLALGGWLRNSRPLGSEADAAWLRERLRPGELLMISSVHCAHCRKARDWLQAGQVPFEECEIERNAACRERWLATGALATPTFVLRGQAVLGLDVPRLKALL